MAEMFRVQKGVPRITADRTPKHPRRKFPVDTMEVDDFFFLPGRATKGVSSYLSRITKNLPGKFSATHCWATKDGDDWVPHKEPVDGAVEGTGVWRIE